MALEPHRSVWSSSAIRRFAVQAGIILVVLSSVVAVSIYVRTEGMLMSSARQQASAYLDLIITTRQWNALNGGVWVQKSGTVRTNPYLAEIGVQADTSTASGVELTLRNPAAMTREISDLVAKDGVIGFRLTSLEPVNPSSAPDEWEREQLKRFTQGLAEAEGITTDGDGRAYRLMRPLVTEEGCLTCHEAGGYRVGDIRGALSVRLDLAETDTELRRNAIGLAILWAAGVASLAFVMFGLVYRMASRLERGEARLRVLASTDELTGLANRRTAMERLSAEFEHSRRGHGVVGVLIIDIDHFKNVNDEHGHATGDEVLTSVARSLAEGVRAYDTVGRIGGEEFLVIAPDIDHSELAGLAERVRAHVEGKSVAVGDGELVRVTVSAGGAMYRGADERADDVLARADAALYAAKEAGRNRVEIVAE